MDVTAIQEIRLLGFDKLAHGLASEMCAGAGPIQLRSFGRRMAD